MSNDATPSSAADRPTNLTSPDEPNTDPAAATESGGQESTDAENVEPEDARTPAQKRVQLQTKKKYDFITALMINLDILIYVELCILYYME